ncbi:MAG TPA: YqeG family HAD IIIA-type phosphatase [Candidatus Atribacteria bacterium]|nr:YqeG family HAD IIIA-type phosphatase [Candidatus Atribacteria bacterium]HPT77869.1 YqeG family HAD IIIA-type phosphatase [Candidatus Atribacteria bacterium]
MLKALKPDLHLASIFDIDLNKLWRSGYRNIIIDVDNTITAWNRHQAEKDVVEWFSRARELGFGICLLSNNSQSTIMGLASELGVLASPTSGKPFSRAFKSALKELSASAGNTVVIGDQIFTDILGGKRAGMYTILVDPIDKREFIGTRLMRLLERVIAGRK